MKIKTCTEKDYESVFAINRNFKSWEEFFDCLVFERTAIKHICTSPNFEVQPRSDVIFCPVFAKTIKIELNDLNEYYNKTKG